MLKKIKTARELMEARYKAYEKKNIEFLVESHFPDTRRKLDIEATKKWAETAEWESLEIISVEDGKENDKVGIVEFRATYKEDGNYFVHHEKSKFIKKDGIWYYYGWLPLTETVIKERKIGRNDFCPCGSKKKYKKCCGK